MSGVTSSKRQWASLRVRALAATLLALAMLIPMIGVAMAQEPAPAAQWPPYGGANQLCIKGSVIDFDETLLPFSDKYTADDPILAWQITATPIDPAGGAALTTTTDDEGDRKSVV